MKSFFVTSTGTGIGKTYVTASLIKQARAAGKSVAAFKPLISGFDDNIAASDTGILIEALGLQPDAATIKHMSPWRFKAPLAPSMAARLEGRPVDFAALVAHSIKAAQGAEDILLVEGVGGVMVPLNDDKTVLDWIAAAHLPPLLVTGDYLGAISHTLTACLALASHGLRPAAIIVNETPEPAVAGTADEVRRWAPDAPVIALKRGSSGEELRVLWDI